MADPGFVAGFIAKGIDILITQILHHANIARRCREELDSLRDLVTSIKPLAIRIRQYRLELNKERGTSIATSENNASQWVSKLHDLLQRALPVVQKSTIPRFDVCSRYQMSTKISGLISEIKKHLDMVPVILLEFKVECEASFSNLIMYLKSVVSHVSARLKGAWASRASYELLRDEEKAIADCRKKDSVIEERHGNINGDNEVELVKRHSNGKQRGAENQTKDGQGKRRLTSLDVFRGLTVALMILVDDAGGILPAINHSPWNGVTLADFVMPFFLFIVGVSLGIVYKKLSNKVVATRKAILKAFKLLILGIVLQGGFFHGINDLTYGVNIGQIRWLGILQRISFGYLLAALCEIWLTRNSDIDSSSRLVKKYCWQWLVTFVLTALYMGLLYGLYVPDWQYEVPIKDTSSSPLNLGSKTYFVKCGVRGDVGPACNAVGMIDRYILGIRHLHQRPVYVRTKECSVNSPDYGPVPSNAPSWCHAPFDPEGILSSFMASVTCFIGLHFGHVLVHFKGHRERMLQWIIPSLGLVMFGCFLDGLGMHLNKALYTFSYMCVTSGTSGLLFAGIYLLVDVYEYRRLTMVLEWMGINALIIYVLVACNLFVVAIQGFYWGFPENNILSVLGIKS